MGAGLGDRPDPKLSMLVCRNIGSLSFLTSSTVGLQGLAEKAGTLTGLPIGVTEPLRVGCPIALKLGDDLEDKF